MFDRETDEQLCKTKDKLRTNEPKQAWLFHLYKKSVNRIGYFVFDFKCFADFVLLTVNFCDKYLIILTNFDTSFYSCLEMKNLFNVENIIHWYINMR